MSVRVGTRYYHYGKFTDPEYKGFKNIIVLTASTAYGSLGPYVLKENGIIFENLYQFSRLYENIPASKQKASSFSKEIIWDHPAEIHVERDPSGRGKITPAYFAWRKKGMNNKKAVRYPIGFKNNGRNILGALYYDSEGKSSSNHASKIDLPEGYVLLDYIDARKKLYFPKYRELVRKEKQFKELKDRLARGENLLIIEVDGPIQKDLPYYQKKYGVGQDFIENDTILINQKNLDIMINDPKNRAGHGYALAAELLGLNT